MSRLVALTVLALLLLPAAAEAKPKPLYKIYLYHVTSVQATGELTRTYVQDDHRESSTARVTIDRRDLRRKGWKGVRNVGFWGTNGWGTIHVPFGEEQWAVSGTVTGRVQDPETFEERPGTWSCGGTAKMKGRGAGGKFERRNGRFVLDLGLPPGPEGPCELEDTFLQGSHDVERGVARVAIDPAKMRRKRFTIPFEHTEHRKFEHDEHDGRGITETEEQTLTWRGTMTVERGYMCTVPPDYPCHTMLM